MSRRNDPRDDHPRQVSRAQIAGEQVAETSLDVILQTRDGDEQSPSEGAKRIDLDAHCLGVAFSRLCKNALAIPAGERVDEAIRANVGEGER